MRCAILTLLIACLPVLVCAKAVKYKIEAGSVENALAIFGRQSGLQTLYEHEAVAGRNTQALKGEYEPRAALERLLHGTGLTFRFVNDHTVTIFLPESASHSIIPSAPAAVPTATNSTRGITEQNDQDLGPPVHVAQTVSSQGSATAQSQLPSPSRAADEQGQISEIVVTAQKKAENLLDVPVPVSVLQAQALVENNQLRLADYYTSIPNFNVSPGIQSSQTLTIRGITSAGGNPTVAVLVDEAPFTASTAFGSGAVVPDIDPSDLARVEVLRGPQGTLYGASSMGGVLKFVTIDPSTEGFSGHIQGGLSEVYNGNAPGYNARASVNVPVTESIAVLANGFLREDPGYIDNILTGQNGINEAHTSGGHLSALWRPADAFSLKLSALYQQVHSGGSDDWNENINGYAGPPPGDLQQYYIRGAGGYDREVQAYSANLNAKLGTADLTAISAYNINQYSDSFDVSYAFGPAAQALYGVSGAPVLNSGQSKKFSQEIRLSAPMGEKSDWLLGGFYTDEDAVFQQHVEATDPTTGEVHGALINLGVPTTYKEYAAFADLTYHFTQRFDIQLGARESRIDQTYTQSETGPAVGTAVILPEVRNNANVFTYLLTPQFKFSPNFMTYARFASGYRPGGPNPSPGNGTPPAYNPDKTKNYEIGAKGDFIDHRLTLDASLYYIDWNGIQISLLNQATSTTYNANGGRAKSEGAELSLEAKPLTGLQIGAWVVWANAVLTGDFPSTSTAYGVSGERLPDSSRFSGNLSVQQDFPLWSRTTGYVGAQASYVSDWLGSFGGTAQRESYPGYTKIDLRAGLKYGAWTVNLFANNVTDRRAVLDGGLDTIPPWAFYGIPPRTVGINVALAFR